MGNTKNLIKLIIGFIVFFFTSYVALLFLKYGIKLDLTSFGKKELALADGCISFIMVLIFTMLYFDVIKDSWMKLRNNFKGRISQFILAIVIGYLIVNAMQILASYISAILFFITGVEMESASNQQTIEELLKSAPLIMIISSCLFAPIEEELLFRGALRKCIKNKKVFIACSGLIFGLMHVTDSIVFIGELLLLGVVIDKIQNLNNKSKNSKIMLSVISVVLIFICFGVFYYFNYGNLIKIILSLDAKEVIGSVTYVIMGITLAVLYIFNDENILTNIGIHALNNIVAIMLSLFLR
ncbi:MAG: CPBP family intramembrane metalloprotease [Bacilli bacterium]|nr:CPBP family intramembrane metalloprotease [Bacilli bacterium]